MKPDPLISVVVPIYNVAEHIAGCITSLRAQTYENIDVIMVDDGSTDASARVATDAAGGDPRFRLLQQDNGGLSAARNTALDHAKGDVIAFVDGDDRVMPDFLAALWDTMRQENADWVACSVNYCWRNASGHLEGQFHSAIHGAPDLSSHPVPRRYDLDDWQKVVPHFPSAWNKLYRRELIDGLTFEEGTWFEDHAFFLQTAARTDHLVHLPQPLYLQTVDRDGQITRMQSPRVFEMLRVLDQVEPVLMANARPGGRAAFARLASRCLSERQRALTAPDMRDEFARQSRLWLTDHDLEYGVWPKHESSATWAMELQGVCPLSVIVPWSGGNTAELDATLDALGPQAGISHETIVVVPGQRHADQLNTLRGNHPGQLRVVVAKDRGDALAQQGLASARGNFVFFAQPGTRPDLAALSDVCNAMIENAADMAAVGLRRDVPGEPGQYLHAFTDTRDLPKGDLADGPFAMRPMLALALGSELSSRVYRSDFLRGQTPCFLSHENGHWATWLSAALTAERVVHVARVCADLPARLLRARSAAALLNGHDAMLRAIPGDVSEQLAPGWQRRLFARALRQDVSAHDGVSKGRKAVRFAALALGAQMRGYGKTLVEAAGFDPSVGSGLAKLMRPQAVLRQAALLPQPDVIADYSAEHALFSFRVGGPALVALRADFTTNDYANVSFFGRQEHRVALHVSLRKREGLIVLNDRRSDGAWYAERKLPFQYDAGNVDLVIELTDNKMRLSVDGEHLAELGTRSIFDRAGFADLGGIRRMGVQGHFTVTEILPDARPSAFTLDNRMQVIAPGTAQDATMQVAHTGEILDVSELELSGGALGLMAALSGRHWRGLAPDQPLEVTLTRADDTVERLSLTRSDMAGRIETILRYPPNTGDSSLVPLVLEHLHHGALLGMLSDRAQQSARSLAKAYGLADYLTDGDTNGAGAAAPLVPRPDRIGAEVEQAMARIIHSQSLDPPAKAIDVLRAMGLSSDGRRATMLSLTDLFCRADMEDAFDELFEHARAYGDAEMLRHDANNWSRTACLPFLLRSGRSDELVAAFKAFASDPSSDWALTAPVAWTLRRLNDGAVKAVHREAILDAAQTLLDNLSWNTWPRAQCAELAQAFAFLAIEPAYAQRLRAAILRVFGLNHAFWAALEDERHLDAQLTVLQEAFRKLHDGLRGHDDPRGLLAPFIGADCIEVPRIERALLEPVSSDEVDGADTAGRTLPALEEEALRRIALPGGDMPGEALSNLTSGAFKALYPEVEQSPQFDRQIDAARLCRAIFEEPKCLEDRETYEELTALLQSLASADVQFLGLGLGASLVATLARHADTVPMAEKLAAWCMAVLDGFPADEQALAAVSPALRAGLLQLRAQDTAVGWPLLSRLAGLGPPLPELPSNGPVVRQAKTIFDAIVVVFSCRDYLETRIPAMRAGCLSLLDDMGIPYVVVVGDGDGTQVGDVVYLDAPDDYEGLPKKTLAALRWVHDHTDAAHMIKLDDDCFLDAPRFFEPLSYRKFHYYGRTLWRDAGQMDRRWHQAKAASQRGQHELDRSFEPSSYCDGGSAYALSRDAIAKALDAAGSPEGQRVLQGAFMEDKMLGDLLALRGIHPSNEDYRISILRRSHPKGRAVSSWLNSFLPSRTTPVPLVHLDGYEAQADVLKTRRQKGLWPKKIWPTTLPVRLGYQTNALELVSSEAQLSRLRDAPVSVVASMRNEMFMLPHFLAHYRAMGVQSFLIADNVSDDGTLEYLEAQPDVAVFSVDTDYNLSDYGVVWQQALLAHFRQGRWSLIADADELLVWCAETDRNLSELLAGDAFSGADAVRLFMLDMYPEGPLEDAGFAAGPFHDAAFADRVPFLRSTTMRGPFSDQPAWTSALRHRLIPQARANLFVAQKIALLRYNPMMRLSAGLHFVSGVQLARQEMFLAHFKYNSDFRRKAQEEVRRQQHFNDAEEYARYLALVSEGQSVIYDPELSMTWSDVPFVARRLIR